mmetsp:Transcript_62644/g.166455  ORF Transcript_62644/g.166455 Transcript_62644/m.166455 type:complete len:103 (+) Transcript_62644:3297-3605(+)
MMSSPSTGEEHAAQPCAVPSLGPHTDGDLHFDVRAQATWRACMNSFGSATCETAMLAGDDTRQNPPTFEEREMPAERAVQARLAAECAYQRSLDCTKWTGPG